MLKLKIENLSYKISDKNILEDISLEISKGSFVGLVGANGSGKSTLLKNIYRVLKPSSGTIYIDEENIEMLNSKKIARKLAVVTQNSAIGFDFTVKDIVRFGRYSYKKFLQVDVEKDNELVKKSLEAVELIEYENRSFLTLSGGEKQRVLVAKALAQDTSFMIMDEPTNHLDIKHQLQIMESIKKKEITVFIAVHDMNIAAMYCDYIIALKDGKIKTCGSPSEIFTDSFFREIFDVNAHVMKHPETGKVLISYFL